MNRQIACLFLGPMKTPTPTSGLVRFRCEADVPRTCLDLPCLTQTGRLRLKYARRY